MLEQKDIWSLATKEELISALWMIAAVMAFTSEIIYLKCLGGVLTVLSIWGFINAIKASSSWYKDFKNRDPNEKLESKMFKSSPVKVDAIFTLRSIHEQGDIQWLTTFDVPAMPLDQPATPEDYNKIVGDCGREWLLQHITMNYQPSKEEGKKLKNESS